MLGDEELGLPGYAAEDELADVKPGEGGDPPVVGMVDLDALHDGDEPAVVVVRGRERQGRSGRGRGVVRGVAAHDEREKLQMPKNARGDVVRDGGGVHARALAQDEAGERGAPAGLVGKRVAEVEADGHGEVELVEGGEAVADFAKGGEVEGERAGEAEAAEAGGVVVEKVVDEAVRPGLGDGGLGGLGVVEVCFEEGVACVDCIEVLEIGKGVEKTWMAVIVVMMVINNELTDVRHMAQEVDNCGVESVRGGVVLLVAGMEDERANVGTKGGCMLETALKESQGGGGCGEIEVAKEDGRSECAKVPVQSVGGRAWCMIISAWACVRACHAKQGCRDAGMQECRGGYGRCLSVSSCLSVCLSVSLARSFAAR